MALKSANFSGSSETDLLPIEGSLGLTLCGEGGANDALTGMAIPCRKAEIPHHK